MIILCNPLYHFASPPSHKDTYLYRVMLGFIYYCGKKNQTYSSNHMGKVKLSIFFTNYYIMIILYNILYIILLYYNLSRNICLQEAASRVARSAPTPAPQCRSRSAGPALSRSALLCRSQNVKLSMRQCMNWCAAVNPVALPVQR